VSAGRPRKPSADDDILHAALEVLDQRGYAGLTLEEVARRARVGKSALYRRFTNRADLATAAIASRQRPLPELTGDVRDDLLAYLRAVEADLGDAGLGVVASLLGHDDEVLALHRQRVIAGRAAHSRALLRAAQSRGAIRSDANLDAAMEMLIGSLFARALAGDRSREPWPERSVDTLLRGLQDPTQRSKKRRR
jgi:AcrR family transcriptional regulator